MSGPPAPDRAHTKGLRVGLYPTGQAAADVEVVAEAERAGYDSIWTAEAYGLDALTPMAWWAAKTTTIKLGTIVAVVDGRSPATTAMSSMTIDHLSGGRFTLGLGVSGPAVVEGWYGRPFARPLARTREYVDVIRQIHRREAPAALEGTFYQLPYDGEASSGRARTLKSSHTPLRPDQPIFLAAEGPRAISLAAEIADGWTAFYLAPGADGYYRERLAEGFSRRPGGPPDHFEVLAQVHLSIDDDVETAADRVRGNVALFVGGMGPPGANFHYDNLARIGFEAECATISSLWSSGDRRGAAASIPLRLIEAIALVGPLQKIRDEMAQWRQTCVTLLVPMLNGRAWDAALVDEVAQIVTG